MLIKTINRAFSKITFYIRAQELKGIKLFGMNVTDREINYLSWIVENNNKKNLTRLAKELGVKKGTLSNNIKLLIEKKLLIKKEDPKDKRKVVITPTDKGKEYMKYYSKIHVKIQKTLLSVLNEKEIEQLLEMGLRINKTLD